MTIVCSDNSHSGLRCGSGPFRCSVGFRPPNSQTASRGEFVAGCAGGTGGLPPYLYQPRRTRQAKSEPGYRAEARPRPGLPGLETRAGNRERPVAKLPRVFTPTSPWRAGPKTHRPTAASASISILTIVYSDNSRYDLGCPGDAFRRNRGLRPSRSQTPQRGGVDAGRTGRESGLRLVEHQHHRTRKARPEPRHGHETGAWPRPLGVDTRARGRTQALATPALRGSEPLVQSVKKPTLEDMHVLPRAACIMSSAGELETAETIGVEPACTVFFSAVAFRLTCTGSNVWKLASDKTGDTLPKPDDNECTAPAGPSTSRQSPQRTPPITSASGECRGTEVRVQGCVRTAFARSLPWRRLPLAPGDAVAERRQRRVLCEYPISSNSRIRPRHRSR